MCDTSAEPRARRLRLPAGKIVFPSRCVRCGRPPVAERLIRKYRGAGLLLHAMMVHLRLQALLLHVFHLPDLMPSSATFTASVPVCRRCREYHAFLQYAGIFAVLATTMFTAGIVIASFFCCDISLVAAWGLGLLVAIAALVVLHFLDRVMFTAIDRALGVRIEDYRPEDQTVTLCFGDPLLAEETLRLNPAAQSLIDP